MSETQASESSESDPELSQGDEGHALRLTQGIVIVAAAMCFALFWWAGGALGIPAHYGYGASLLQQPGVGAKVEAIVVALVGIFSCAITAQALAGRRWILAGPFCAALGLAAWSARGGPSRYVYFHAVAAGAHQSVFVVLALELLLLFVGIAIVWYWIVGHIDAASINSPALRRPVSPGVIAQALGTQILCVGLAAIIFVQSDVKGTAMLGLFIAAIIGTALTEHWYKDQHLGRWYWIGPLLVGVIGYLLNALLADPGTLLTGHPIGPFAALARPLPLDYASAGVLGALLGYWIGAEHPDVPDAVFSRRNIPLDPAAPLISPQPQETQLSPVLPPEP